MDARVEWIRETLKLYFAFEDNAFDNLMSRIGQEGQDGAAVESFLASDAPVGATLFLFTNTFEEEREVKRTVQKEIRVPKPRPAPTEDAAEGEGEGGGDGDEDQKAAEAAAKAKASEDTTEESKSGADSEGKGDAEEDAAEGEEEEFEIQYVDEIVTDKEMVTVHRLTAMRSQPTAASKDGKEVECVYFMRIRSGHISLSEEEIANNAMSDWVEFGFVADDPLRDLEAIMKDIYTPLIEPQLLGPQSSHLHAMSETQSEDYRSINSGMQSQSYFSSAMSRVGGRGGGTGMSVMSRGGGGGGLSGMSTISGGGAGSVISGGNMGGTGERGAFGITGTMAVGASAPAPESPDTALMAVGDSIKGEFRSALHRFESNISHALQQLGGEVKLEIPDLDIQPEDIKAASEDYATVNMLEEALEKWTRSVASVLDALSSAPPVTKGPLAEIEFWRQRNATLSAVWEQLNQPRVKNMLEVLKRNPVSGLEAFNAQNVELNKKYVEAKDNVKFLSTLERHFKNLSSGNLAIMYETIPRMMDGLRMVWVISRHYNKDERMLPLMMLIAKEIAEKVGAEVNIKTVLRKEPLEALHVLQEANKVLVRWREAYYETRRAIEEITDMRWEFDRKLLFDQTDHMSKICENLITVVNDVNGFRQFFMSQELRAVTTNPRKLAEVVNLIKRLTRPLQRVSFNVFDKDNESRWTVEMASFREKLGLLERKARDFIDQAFQRLRSAEGAFELLSKFQHLDSRETIKNQMMQKLEDIIHKARQELKTTHELFEEQKASPPAYRDYPPAAGAISWAWALYMKQKRPILRFRRMSGLLDSGEGHRLKEDYLRFAKAVDAYIKSVLRGWKASVDDVVEAGLSQPILGPSLLPEKLTINDIPAIDEERGITVGMAAASAAAAAASALDDTADPIAARCPPPPYRVNFSQELRTLMRESRYLDRMGYLIPDAAMNVTLQESQFLHHSQRLQLMLDRYHALLNDMRPVEATLLQKQLATLRSALRPGFSPLNWNSLHIDTFLAEADTALADFNSILQQVRKSSAGLENAVTVIERTVLIQEGDFTEDECYDITEFYERGEKLRSQRLEELVEAYGGVTEIMQQVERFIAETDTCAAPELAEWYRYWEGRFYNAIAKMILASFASFQSLLNLSLDGSGRPYQRKVPLLRVQVDYSPPDVVLVPDSKNIIDTLDKAVSGILDSARRFQRWMDGSCIPCPVPPANDDETAPDFSFYADINHNPLICQAYLNLNTAIQNSRSRVKNYIDGWRRFDTTHELWSQRKKVVLEKLAEKKPSAQYLDLRIEKYVRLKELVEAQPTEKDIWYLRLDCEPVALKIKERAQYWADQYGAVMEQVALTKIAKLHTEFEELRAGLEAEPTDLDSLKEVLGVVAGVRNRKMDVELEISDIMERYRIVQRYGIAVRQELHEAMELADTWQTIVNGAKTKDIRLQKVKEEFREVTKTEVLEFAAGMRNMKREYLDNGPASAHVSLADGVGLVKDYRKRIAEAHARRERLMEGERLFGLPITRYDDLISVEQMLGQVSRLYDLYIESKNFQDRQSNMTWAALDIPELKSGV